MRDEDLLRCPLLQGLDPMNRAELMALLNDSGVREKLEKCLAEHTSAAEPAAVCAHDRKPGEFEKEVHSWNPQRPTWTRSPKE
jgi:hypothetical protein